MNDEAVAAPPNDKHLPRLASKDLLGLESMSREEIQLILDNAVGFKTIVTRTVKRVPTLRGKTVVNLFFENSTRTRTSFELAARRLSADVLNFDVATSSVNKGESLLDTVETIQALGADFVVMRHGSSGAHQYLGRQIAASLINAGDGSHEHPTQGLLDMFTILEQKGRLEGLRVAIVGDVLHSRVARSNIWGLQKMGAHVVLVGPPTLVPDSFRSMGVEVCHNLKDGIRRADVVYMLRIQMERQSRGLFPSLREYRHLFGLDLDKLQWAKSDALVMHPGPVNLDVEISRAVMTCPQSKVIDQITNGLAVRMACLYLLRGASGHGTHAGR